MNYKLIHIMDILEMERFLLVDVGASGGIDQRWKALGDRLFLIGFEPNEEEYRKLNKMIRNGRLITTKYINIALADKRCCVDFFINRKQDTSSCYRTNARFLKRFPLVERFNLEKSVPIDADSLDNVLLSEGFEKVDFIKIDTQGYELNILRGGEKTIHRYVCGLEVEVEFSMLYEGQPLFADIDAYLRSLDFILFDLRPCYWKRTQNPLIGGVGQIVCADALYFKDYIAMDSIPTEIGPPIIMSIVYNKCDYAMELVEYLYSKGRIALSIKKEIQLIIGQLARPVLKIPNFRGKARVASYFERLGGLLKSPHWVRWDSWKT